jgi:hypothetical protein
VNKQRIWLPQGQPPPGFDITVTLPAGLHSVCTYAINVGPGTGNPWLGCRTVRT